MPTSDRALLIEILTTMSYEADQLDAGLQSEPDVSGVGAALRDVPNTISFVWEAVCFAHELVRHLAKSAGVTPFEVLQRMANE